METETQERYRLAVLGSGKVGKTSIIRRYLNNTFSERYRETVEDIFSRTFYIQGAELPLDVYDTNFYYPDMRKLTLSSANAFLIVYASDNVASFKDANDLINEIMERRTDFRNIPFVIVANKCDISQKKILPETVNLWIKRLPIQENMKYLEVSAKENISIVETFKALLDLSGFPFSLKSARNLNLTPNFPRRNMSVRGKSPCRIRNGSVKASPPSSPRKARQALRRSSCSSNEDAEEEKKEGKNFTRHASLIRRTNRFSLKIRHVETDRKDESDCNIQ